jgi:DNA polymerase-1
VQPPLFKINPLFTEEKQQLILDYANVTARAFSSQNAEADFLNLLVGMLLKYRKLFSKHNFVFALEGKGKQKRREIYPGYKLGGREHQSYSRPLFSKSLELLNYLKCEIIRAPNGEADDAIAARILRDENSCHTVIVSEDRDLWQLVKDPYVEVHTRNGLVSEAEVYQRYHGLGPDKIFLLKVFLGDKSDNIPRVPTLTKQKMLRLIKNANSVKQVFIAARKASWLTTKERTGVRDFKKQALINAKLVKLRGYNKIITKTRKPKPVRCRKFFQQCGVYAFSKDELNLLTGKTSHEI